MKHAILTFTVCLSILMSLIFNGCTQEVIYDRSNLPDGVLVIDSYAAGFEKVVSKATPKNPFEYSMTSKCLLVFDKNGAIISKEFKGNGDASFLVDRNIPPFSDHDQTLMDACKLYIVANLQESDFTNITSRTDLLNMKINAQSSIHLDKLSNFAGLPMIGGVDNVNLQKDVTVIKPIAPIELRTIYAKVVVDIQLNIEQNVPGNIPMFHLKKWTVHNAPGYATLGATSATDETQFVLEGGTEFVTHAGENKLSQGTNPITNGGKHMVFDFYVLEHRVNVKKTFTYPNGIKPEQQQRFKPNLMNADQKPLYITIEGVYTDHQGHDKKITYNLYLGENNWNNFHINRNCLIQNNVTIKGITNEKEKDDPGTGQGTENVSVDNRVNIDHSQEDFIIKVERETMLDSHIEIRPLDIELKTEGSGNKVVVEIVDPNNQNAVLTDATRANLTWMRFEKKNSNPDQNTKYCSNGKRKYFTKTLMDELDDNKKEPLYGINTVITSNSDNRIWVYFDENLNASADGMREATLKFTYYENASPKKEVYYKFRQHDLYPVTFTDETNTTRTYYLEFYEEYLYNFDPKDPYTSTKEGMPWGVIGANYSSEIKAIKSVSGILDSKYFKPIKDAIVAKAGYYDYENLFDGAKYTKKLINQGNKGAGIEGETAFTILQLDQTPRSAAEYCYNKNKRDDNGNVVDMDWYLPAIGEIQQITTGAYSKFAVFQEQYYWSSQTSYIPGTWYYQGFGGYDGVFKYEDVNYARATRTIMVNGKPTYESSEVEGAILHLEAWWSFNPLGVQSEMRKGNPDKFKRHSGNHLRSNILRVRAIRKTAKTANP